ncbi:MAG: 16S rRNA (uracil(1498)-N(3))-methyltransferase [Gemmataceae bacterium]|nr:16S rRNA (uracil(1498)-N(3))-methyltransferase [Gemmataceae bacterium]
MAARFYLNWQLQPGPVTVEGAEAHHLASVCRLRPGDVACLFNGDGCEYPARIVEVRRKAVLLEIQGVESPQRELPFVLEVAAPLPKGDRAQFLVEKLTELGATAFVPLDCERSVIHPREAKLEKLERYVIEASKQCGRNALMRVAAPAPWLDYAAQPGSGDQRWLAHPSGAGLGPQVRPQAGIHVAVGPEGGFTDAEVNHGRDHGWELIGLGPRILRIETAALALAAWAALSR